MNKPIVFFSHSSRDKSVLMRLKESVQKKTGNSIEIFLSSDGQSIPFGKNWVHSIEKSLEESKLCFIFLSPNSINSQWVYFESGFTYSKKIKVIPVGIIGIDLTTISPPLSLLQGFNVFNNEGFNNIIEIINREFEFDFNSSFTDSEYEHIIGTSDIGTSYFGEANNYIDDIDIHCSNAKHDNIHEEVTAFLLGNKIEVTKQLEQRDNPTRNENFTIQSFGFIFHYEFMTGRVSIDLDKNHINRYVSFLDLFGSKYNYEKGQISFTFIEGTTSISKRHKLTALLFNSKIKIDDLHKFSYDNLTFDIYTTTNRTSGMPYVYMNIYFNKQKYSDLPINDLIKLLFDLGVIEYINY